MNKICSVFGCERSVRAKNLCGAHYERLRIHGDILADNRKRPIIICHIENCTNKAVAKNICAKHYARKLRHGNTDSLVPNYGSYRIVHEQGYIQIWQGDSYKFEHIIVAEKALGRPLPSKAVVHHINEVPWDNRPENLLICPDQAYHLLMHRRMKQLNISFKPEKRDE